MVRRWTGRGLAISQHRQVGLDTALAKRSAVCGWRRGPGQRPIQGKYEFVPGTREHLDGKGEDGEATDG